MVLVGLPVLALCQGPGTALPDCTDFSRLPLLHTLGTLAAAIQLIPAPNTSIVYSTGTCTTGYQHKMSEPVQKWALRDIARVLRKPRLQRSVALELQLLDGVNAAGTAGGSELHAVGLTPSHPAASSI